ncbi:PCI domain-containing protein [Mycena chlorophos]|uniref:PCI domain-containing protein n=1 Tax=Mycena chlorophos TaxID=658473 RepID=A0A8H6S747_MYCCL|nr:PCI domain-containing protein [Mycena chlorophos]
MRAARLLLSSQYSLLSGRAPGLPLSQRVGQGASSKSRKIRLQAAPKYQPEAETVFASGDYRHAHDCAIRRENDASGHSGTRLSLLSTSARRLVALEMSDGFEDARWVQERRSDSLPSAFIVASPFPQDAAIRRVAAPRRAQRNVGQMATLLMGSGPSSAYEQLPVKPVSPALIEAISSRRCRMRTESSRLRIDLHDYSLALRQGRQSCNGPSLEREILWMTSGVPFEPWAIADCDGQPESTWLVVGNGEEVDKEDKEPDCVRPMITRTSIYSAFLGKRRTRIAANSDGDETPPKNAAASWLEVGSLLQALMRRVQDFRSG